MNHTAMKEVQSYIKERTIEMESEEYAAFLRELSEWAQMQADMADYSDDILQHFDND